MNPRTPFNNALASARMRSVSHSASASSTSQSALGRGRHLVGVVVLDQSGFELLALGFQRAAALARRRDHRVDG